MELWMHLGGFLSPQEARVVRGDYASFVLNNLPRASITPWLHAARLPFLKCVLLRTLFRYLASIKIRTSSFEWSVLFFHFRLSITIIDETQGVLYSSLTIIPSSSISVSFSRAGSRSALGIFLGDVPLEELTDQLPNVLC